MDHARRRVAAQLLRLGACRRDGEPARHHVEHRREEQAEERHAEHAEEHRGAEAWRISAPAPVAIDQRQHAEDEGEGRSSGSAAAGCAPPATAASHRLAPSSSACRANSTIRMAFLAARPTSTTRPICDQDVVVEAAQQHAEDRGEQAHRHDQDDRQRQQPALVHAPPAAGRRTPRPGRRRSSAVLPASFSCRRARSIRSRSPPAGVCGGDLLHRRDAPGRSRSRGSVAPCTSAAGNRL